MELEHVSVDVLATVIGLTPRQIQRLVTSGVLSRSGRGNYDLAACVQAWGAHLTAGKEIDTGLGAARQQLVSAQAHKTQLEAAALAGELVPLVDVQIVLNESMVIIASQMEALPGRLAAVLAGESKPALISSMLKSEIRRIRQAAADRLSSLVAMNSDSKNPTAPTRKKKRSVGKRKSRTTTGKRRAR